MDFESIDPDNIDYGQEDTDDFEEGTEAKEQALQELLEDEGIKTNLARVENRDWEWVNESLGLKPENRIHPNYPKIVRLLKDVLKDQYLDGLL
ncbi:MAG: hypothetical protein A3H51_01240 [Candidatus Spechtbacteria bacterium RIFCSPLOWO2_02_FULL_38_8]|uniref:Uncharacterized protein n=1 Tax=Candidatus Spechtbacteria bacterium RIFCSPLOWO2_02_FULL_38_8 TaxID=1802164 RepID=A0A1G2HFW6_9BACT|nr:MAG: hypothetical protein A3H51_01240 [Candidatus Spechtbacteria bacterium RIFCSPLOWO2_02_FULL_38_8]